MFRIFMSHIFMSPIFMSHFFHFHPLFFHVSYFHFSHFQRPRDRDAAIKTLRFTRLKIFPLKKEVLQKCLKKLSYFCFLNSFVKH